MPRNSAGVYTLPPTNPVVPFTTIATSWANPTMSDIATALTDSLDRNGRGGMLAPFKIFDGTLSGPGLGFLNEPSLGIYRSASGIMNFVSGGVTQMEVTAGGSVFPTEVAHYGDSQYRKTGYKWWQINNWGGALMITPSATADAEDWDTAKSVVFNPDGTVDFPTGALDYLPLTGGTITGNLGVTGTLSVNGTTTLGQTLNLAHATSTSLVALSTTVPGQWSMIGTYAAWGATPTLGVQPAASVGFQAREAWTDSARGTNIIFQGTRIGSATMEVVAEFSPSAVSIPSQLHVSNTNGGQPSQGSITFGNGTPYLFYDGANFYLNGGGLTVTNLAADSNIQYKTATPVPQLYTAGSVVTLDSVYGLSKIITLTTGLTCAFANIPQGGIMRVVFLNTNLGLTITGVSWPNGVNPNFTTGPLKKALVVITNDSGTYLGTYSVF